MVSTTYLFIGAGRRDRARALLHRLMLAEAVVGLVATALFESCRCTG